MDGLVCVICLARLANPIDDNFDARFTDGFCFIIWEFGSRPRTYIAFSTRRANCHWDNWFFNERGKLTGKLEKTFKNEDNLTGIAIWSYMYAVTFNDNIYY